jgi:hypothetical protein
MTDEIAVLKAQLRCLRKVQRGIMKQVSPLLERLSILGVEEHWHGDGTYESPCWTHAHPFEDKKHEHAGTPEERAAQDAARADWE